MNRMSVSRFVRSTLIVGLLLTSYSFAYGEEVVRFQLKSGDTITGELLEPDESGGYRVRVEDRVVVIPHDDVYTTLAVADGLTPKSRPKSDRAGSSTRDVLRKLQQRLDLLDVPAESLRVYRSCLAEASRGDWDFAIRSASRLLEMEPSWPDPQILRAQLLAERGQVTDSISIAFWLESSAPDDILALSVASNCYRRGSFSRRAATVSERVFELQHSSERALYERVQLWWQIDRRVGEAAWSQFVESDPLLRSPWCREGKILQRAELALAASDWEAAQAAIDELNAVSPWARNQARPVELRIAERRLREGEARGRLEEALVALETLRAIDPDRDSEWKARRTALIEHHLRRGLAEGDFLQLRVWATRSSAIFRDNFKACQRISRRFQSMGCHLITTSQLELAEHAFAEASRWDKTARPADLENLLRSIKTRVRDDVAMRRTLRVLRTAEILRDVFPERRDALLDEFSDIVRDELREVATLDEISNRVAELRGLFLRPTLSAETSGIASVAPSVEVGDSSSADTLRLTTLSYPSLSRYFPHSVGTRWVYEVPGGRREEHKVKMLTPLEGGGWKIDIEVRADDAPHGHVRSVFVRGGDLLNGFDSSPPAEVALRYPLSHGAKWAWEKGAIKFTRELSRPKKSLSLPFGTVRDYIVVEAINTIDAGESRQYSIWQRIYYAAGIGIVKIEAEDDSLSRTLLEYVPTADHSRTATRTDSRSR